MYNLKKGVLIAIEGIDGSGKSTLAKVLHHYLENKFSVFLTKEPGATSLGQILRNVIQKKDFPICPKAEFLIFASDRAQHFNELIIPKLHKKKLIISDRMSDSSLIYQGFGRGLDIDSINVINKWVMNNIHPDLTIYVKVSAELAEKRILQRKLELTAFEKEKKDFFIKLVKGFDILYKNRTDVIIINGDQSPKEVANQALKELNLWIKQNQLIA